MKKLPIVLMYGGGRQSVTITGLIIEGLLPVPDVTLIADTGREKETTWLYLENYVQPAYPTKIHRVKAADWATVDLYGGKNKDTLLIPAFTTENGSVGKMPTFCSNEWKARVCDRFLKNELGIKDFIAWIGFSHDEQRRIVSKRRSMGDSVWFPLSDGVPMTKQQCTEYPTKRFGWPTPVHSACYMCPLQDEDNWRQNTPADKLRAIEFDEQMRAKDPNAFLHRTAKPMAHLYASDFKLKDSDKQEGKEPCDSGLCML